MIVGIIVIDQPTVFCTSIKILCYSILAVNVTKLTLGVSCHVLKRMRLCFAVRHHNRPSDDTSSTSAETS